MLYVFLLRLSASLANAFKSEKVKFVMIDDEACKITQIENVHLRTHITSIIHLHAPKSTYINSSFNFSVCVCVGILVLFFVCLYRFLEKMMMSCKSKLSEILRKALSYHLLFRDMSRYMGREHIPTELKLLFTKL